MGLGGREEKSNNPVMARVGERMRNQEKILVEGQGYFDIRKEKPAFIDNYG